MIVGLTEMPPVEREIRFNVGTALPAPSPSKTGSCIFAATRQATVVDNAPISTGIMQSIVFYVSIMLYIIVYYTKIGVDFK